MNQKELRRYLNVIKRAVAMIEADFDDDGGLMEQIVATVAPVVKEEPLPKPDPPIQPRLSRRAPLSQEITPENPKPIATLQSDQARKARQKHIADLMAIDCWPEQIIVPGGVKEPTEQEQIGRANAVLDSMLDRHIEGLTFLDFGCGDGWFAKQALERGVIESFGFDIVSSNNWSNIKKAKFTTNFADLKPNYFDVIMLYDVLDHCQDPILVMDQIKMVMKRDATVYVRCHPWTSKHATHLFRQGINKAYFHLFLKWEEIKELIKREPMFTRQEKNAAEAYRWWFRDFEIRKERVTSAPVSDFFYVPAFKELLSLEQEIPMAEIDNFLKRMETQFIDFCLVRKP